MFKFQFPKPPPGEGSYARPILIGLFTSVAGILSGYDAGTIGGLLATTFFTDNFSTGHMKYGERVFTANQSALLVGILSVGTFLGSLLASPFGDHMGRKWGIIAACAVFTVGVVCQTAATGLAPFIVGRAIAGVGVGVTSVLGPLYQAETAPAWVRGSITSTYQLALTFGIFLAAAIEAGTHSIDNTASYRIPVGLQALWAIILAMGMFFLPDTPAYLVKREQFDKAKKALKFLNGMSDDTNVATKIDEIKEIQRAEAIIGTGTWKQVFSSNNSQRKRLITGVTLMGMQQLTGINFIFYFGTEFFKNAGISDPFKISLITTSVNVLSTFPGIYLVEKWGRRTLLLTGAIGMFASQLVVAVIGTIMDSKVDGMKTIPTKEQIHQYHMANNILISFVCIFIFFFASSWGPVSFTYVSEIFPTRVRAKSMGLCLSGNWALNLAIAFGTPQLTGQGSSVNLGPKIFFVWAVCNALNIAFVSLFVYETKGLSLTQVDDMYAHCSKAWKSNAFRKSLLAGPAPVEEASGDMAEFKPEEIRISDVNAPNQPGRKPSFWSAISLKKGAGVKTRQVSGGSQAAETPFPPRRTSESHIGPAEVDDFAVSDREGSVSPTPRQ